MRDPWGPIKTPAWFTGGSHDCNEIRNAMTHHRDLFFEGVPPNEGEDPSFPDNNSFSHQTTATATNACLAEDSFSRGTLAPLLAAYATTNSCRARDALNTANQTQCMLNEMCRLMSIVASEIQDNAELLESYRRVKINRERQAGACASAALQLEWVTQGCTTASTALESYTVIYPAAHDPYDKGYTYSEVTCNAHVTHNKTTGETAVVTDPGFIEITGEFNADEFNLRIGRGVLLTPGLLTPQQISDSDAALAACSVPNTTDCR